MMQVLISQVNMTNDKNEDSIDINIVVADKDKQIDDIIEKYKLELDETLQYIWRKMLFE